MDLLNNKNDLIMKIDGENKSADIEDHSPILLIAKIFLQFPSLEM